MFLHVTLSPYHMLLLGYVCFTVTSISNISEVPELYLYFLNGNELLKELRYCMLPVFAGMQAVKSFELKESNVEFVLNPLHQGGTISSNTANSITQSSEKHQSLKHGIPYDEGPSNQNCTLNSRSAIYWKSLDASMVTVGVIVFVGDTSRGVLFPMLSTLCTQLGGSVIDLGYLVAMFSIGRLIVTAPFGYISDRYRHKLPLLISSFILVLGSVLWANAFATNRISVLYFAQFLLGVGSGSLGVTRSFVVEQCDPKKRTETLALFTALQYAGFTVSPIVGSWLHFLGGGTSVYMSFALPSYLIALLALWCLIALLSVFKNILAAPVVYTHSTKEVASSKGDNLEVEDGERKLSPDFIAITSTPYLSQSADSISVKETSRSENENIMHKVEKAKFMAISENRRSYSEAQLVQNGMFYVIIGMFLLNISTKGSIAVYETLGAQIGLVDYNMSPVALGTLISASGAVGFCQLLLFPRLWTKNFTGE